MGKEIVITEDVIRAGVRELNAHLSDAPRVLTDEEIVTLIFSAMRDASAIKATSGPMEQPDGVTKVIGLVTLECSGCGRTHDISAVTHAGKSDDDDYFDKTNAAIYDTPERKAFREALLIALAHPDVRQRLGKFWPKVTQTMHLDVTDEQVAAGERLVEAQSARENDSFAARLLHALSVPAVKEAMAAIIADAKQRGGLV